MFSGGFCASAVNFKIKPLDIGLDSCILLENKTALYTIERIAALQNRL